MTLPPDQRRLLAAFLRMHREALSPEAAGQTPRSYSRRRTPGLRREEVAMLCGLSTTWYTWLEQGRDISLSGAALARLADALQLTPAERIYLFELARRRDPAPPVSVAEPVEPPSELMDLLRATESPAYLLTPHWVAAGWNDAAAHLFEPWFGSGEMCLLRYVFLAASARAFILDWEDRARRLIAEFRADTVHNPDDPEMRALVDDLMANSPAFAQFWNSHAVLAREGGARIFNHPKDGTLRYEQVTLIPAAHPGHKFVALIPK
jgi:transcriptional regulator with XRE-family HTH domain